MLRRASACGSRACRAAASSAIYHKQLGDIESTVIFSFGKFPGILRRIGIENLA